MIRILRFFLLASLLNSCGSKNSRDIVQGPARYGDTITLSIPEALSSLHPLFNTDIYSHRVLSNIFEPLFEIDDKTNQVVPRVAEKFEWLDDSKRIRIYIRKGIYFHDDDCFDGSLTELTSEDVRFTLELACSNNKLNQTNDALLGKIKGAEDFYHKRSSNIEGIKIINSHCLDLILNGKFTHLPQLLTSSSYGICSQKAHEFYKNSILSHPIGTGPFILTTNSSDYISLDYNPNYWKKDQYGNLLPYLNSLVFKIIKNEKQEILSFKSQITDLISEVSPQYIDEILSDLKHVQADKPFAHKVIVIPGSRVSMIVLNQRIELFQDARIRQAIDLIIDRDYIANELLNGDGIPASKGLAPNSSYYNNSELPDKIKNIALAQQLFKSAGYGTQKDFPPIHLYFAGINNNQTKIYCKYLAKQLNECLGITCKIHMVDIKTRLDAVKQNKAQCWKLGWSPDYPDPEAYFSLFYSKNAGQNPLLPKTNSAIYDFNYESGMAEMENSLRNNYFTNCDLILQQENWVLPIMYEDFVFVYNLKVRGLHISPMGLMDFTTAFIKPL